MEWMDLRNPLAERRIAIAAESGGAVDYTEVKEIDGQIRLLLLRRDAAGEETILFTATAGDSSLADGWAAGEDDWRVAAAWDGAEGMAVYGLSSFGAVRWRRRVECPGKPDWFFPLGPDRFLVRYQLAADDPLYAAYQKETGLDRVAFLYGPDSIFLVKDPAVCRAGPAGAVLHDGMVVLSQAAMAEADKEQRYLEERSRWIGRPEARDQILVIDAAAMAGGIEEGANTLPFQTAASVGIDSYARFVGAADGRLYYRTKFFPAGTEKLCAWELGSGRVRTLSESAGRCVYEKDKAYRVTAGEQGGWVEGLCGSELAADYPTRYGTVRRVLRDRYLVLTAAPSGGAELVTMYDTRTGRAETWEGGYTVAAETLILW